MEYLSIAAIGLYGILFVTMAIVIPTAIIFNIRAGIRYRKRLAQRLNQLRISGMLNALGIDVNQYLHQEYIHEINNHMTRCSECENTDQCDRELATGNVDTGNISYCNNEAELQEIAARQKQTD